MEKYSEEQKNFFGENNTAITININKRIITIPKALPLTIQFMQEISSFRNEMVREGEKESAAYDPDDIYASPINFYERLCSVLNKYNDKYSRILEKKYNCKMFFSYPKYMSDFHSICSTAENKVEAIYRQQNERYKIGFSVAEREAEKQLKGMSFGIITNSLSSALLYAGMSAITYASQAQKAQKTYDEILKRYVGDGVKIQEIEIIKNIASLIYPVSEKTAAIFLEDVLKEIDKVVGIQYGEMSDKHKTHVLVGENHYVYGDTQALREAIQQLKTIRAVKDNLSKVVDVIEECPYCPEAYFKLIQMKAFDIELFRIAKIVNIEQIILPELKKALQKNTTVDSISILEIIAIYKSESIKQVALHYYTKNIDFIKHQYKTVALACDDIKKMDQWIKDNIESDPDNIVNYTDNQMIDEITLWMKDNFFDEGTFRKLLELGMLSTGDIKLEKSTEVDLKKINDEYRLKMGECVIEYMQELRRRKKTYEDAYEIFHDGVRERKEVISTLSKELKKQGFFAFSKKKRIKAEIDRLEKELDEYKKTEPIEVMNAYYNMR